MSRLQGSGSQKVIFKNGGLEVSQVKKPGDQSECRVEEQARGNSKAILGQFESYCPDTSHSCAAVCMEEVEGLLNLSSQSNDREWTEG